MTDEDLRALILQMDTAASKVNNAVRVDASLAVLKPFLAKLWDEAYVTGRVDVHTTLRDQHAPAKYTLNPFGDYDD